MTEKHKCQHKGCTKDSDVVCIVPEQDNTGIQVIEHLCEEHAYESGYCVLCGEFWGGIETFDIDNPSHLCENCLEQIKDETGENDTNEYYEGFEEEP